MSYQVHVCIYRVIITLKTSWFALVHSYLDVSKLISLLFIFPWTNLLNKYKISRIRTQCNRELLLFRYIDVLHARVSRKFSNRKEGQKRPKSELRWTVFNNCIFIQIINVCKHKQSSYITLSIFFSVSLFLFLRCFILYTFSIFF